MSNTSKHIHFRAVHAKTPWRKARHETLANAKLNGNRSARALFRGENDAIDYAKHGEPLYVVIWADGATRGEVLKADASVGSGIRAEEVEREDIDRWERANLAPIEELENYFNAETTLPETEPADPEEPPLGFAIPKDAEQLEAQLQAAIRESRNLSREARQERLNSADPAPRRIQVQTTAFLRNADVIVSVLERAGGRCEDCEALAPFLRASDGSPYLEVHHVVPLSHGGSDTVVNAKALCPTCHRRIHFGKDST